MKTVLALRHLAFEDLGLLDPWLRQRGWRVEYRDVGVDERAVGQLLLLTSGRLGEREAFPWRR